MNFSGKVALITGAGSPQGIGFATARLLAQQGSKIAITSTTERIEERARELAAEGADVFAFPADLRDQERTHALVLALTGNLSYPTPNPSTAALDRSEIDAYGKIMPLQADMLLRADIILEKRPLISWLLDPLLSVRM